MRSVPVAIRIGAPPYADGLEEIDPTDGLLPYVALVSAGVVLALFALFTQERPLESLTRAWRSVAALPGTLPRWLAEEDRVQVGVRQILYCGVFGAVGATLGWFIWVALAILAAKPHEVWISALVGGALGVILDVVRRYYRQATRKPQDNGQAGFPLLVPGLSVAGIFVATAAENSLGELVKEVRFPFLFSVLTFLLGGIAVLGAARAADRIAASWGRWTAPFVLMFLGAVVAMPLSLLNMLSGVGPNYQTLIPWWTLITLIAGLAVLCARHASWRAVNAAAVAAVLTVGFLMYVAFTPQEAHFCDEHDAAYIRGCGTQRVLILSSLSLARRSAGGARYTGGDVGRRSATVTVGRHRRPDRAAGAAGHLPLAGRRWRLRPNPGTARRG